MYLQVERVEGALVRASRVGRVRTELSTVHAIDSTTREVQSNNEGGHAADSYRGRGTSLIRKRLLLGPCSRSIPRALWWS